MFKTNKTLNSLKFFCINLDKSPERWERVTANFIALEQQIERFPGIDGKLTTADQVPPLWKENNFYGHGWCGCALSHYKLWEHILHYNLPYACILEDDAKMVARIENISVPEDFDILYLSNRISYGENGKAIGGCGTEAYIVSSKGCEKLLRICEDLIVPIDLRIQAHIRGFIESGHFLCKGFSPSDKPCHSFKNDSIIIEGYRTPKNYTVHEDYGISYVNG